jgi:hypothetical protein
MKQEDFKDPQSLQENITKKHKCDDGTPLHFLEAIMKNPLKYTCS